MGAWGVGAWALAVTGALALGWAAFVPLSGRAANSAVVIRSLPTSFVRLYPADSLSEFVVARDLFRAGRRPAGVAYNPSVAAAVSPLFSIPKPALALVGVVHGDDPTAIVEGFPGVEGGRVVRVGDRVGELHVVGIAPDRVRIVGMDTVWVLKVREPWK